MRNLGLDEADFAQAIKQAAIEMEIDEFSSKQRETASYLSTPSSVLREPEVMLTHTPRIPGLDGRKMSKSYGNAIMLSESDDDIRKKTKVMVTDPARKRRTDPGNPDVCPVFDWHKLFSPPETQAWAAHGCRTAGIGCIECKAAMAENLIKWIEPVRQRRLDFERDPRQVLEYLDTGSNARAHGRAADHGPRARSRLPLEREAQRNRRWAGSLWPR